ncbi:sorting receptor for vacuolar protein, Vps10 [Schizosaccharomyces osmophilus]|uniref:Sorting receptor for vacuolar protein, Vps10 n=1 Tax=Schizosaccharomyces osmophilus TaxID=2545709 RepID=A0AAE9WE38_9SCHI|nr:sorting receptor for vacuolar protein, Vps10 [Schizosaccharomyces osmophilus]WBW74203.1 sorting receptor for vacuolar protein, Vps10 [Schizosaccharomyces osmophilus]
MRLKTRMPHMGGTLLPILSCILAVSLLFSRITAAPAAEITETIFDANVKDFMTFEDSSNVLFLDPDNGDLYLSNDNGENWQKGDVPDQNCHIKSLVKHTYTSSRVFALTDCNYVYYSYDNGDSWDYFLLQHQANPSQIAFHFHAGNPDYVIFNNMYCSSSNNWVGRVCRPDIYYTNDGFTSGANSAPVGVSYCIFSHSTELMEVASDDQIICISETPQKASHPPFNKRLISTNDWFNSLIPIRLHHLLGSDGVYGVLTTGSFIITALLDAATGKLFVYVSQDGINWQETLKFHKGFEFDAFTILPSTDYALVVDNLDSHPNNPTGVLYTLDFDSSTFVLRMSGTNRYLDGYVDFTQVNNVDGLMFVNSVDNLKEVDSNPMAEKLLKTYVTFNGGKSWSTLTPPSDACDEDDDNCSLNLYMDPRSSYGMKFSPFAPGVLLALGSATPHLSYKEEMSLFVSEDAGRTWALSRSGFQFFAMSGFGSIFFACEEKVTDEVYYSLNRGRTWITLSLDRPIKPLRVYPSVDPYSDIFYLVSEAENDGSKRLVYSLNFGKFLKECRYSSQESGKNDFELWYTKYEKGKPACSEMGRIESSWRKKRDAVCSAPRSLKKVHHSSKDCECDESSYECNTQFSSNEDGTCELLPFVGSVICAAEDVSSFEKYSYRRIPGNTCTSKKNGDFEKPKSFSCDDFNVPGRELTASVHDFPEELIDIIYLEGTVPEEKTFLIGLSKSSYVYFSSDSGKAWNKFTREKFVAIYPDSYQKNTVYLINHRNEVYFTNNRGRSFYKFKAPASVNHNGKLSLMSHPTRPSWLMFTGESGCENGPYSETCHDVVFYSLDYGDNWTQLSDEYEYCSWIRGENLLVDDSLIFCLRTSEEDIFQKNLYASTDFFENIEYEIMDNVVGFMIEDKYVVLAVQDNEGSSLSLQVSIDGLDFASCDFPGYLNVNPKQSYTILDSTTHSLFIHVTTSARLGSEWGDVLKSNSNGTYFMTSLENVNRDSIGYVDFERVEGIRGVALANIVSNVHELGDGGDKKLHSLITFNDGLDWKRLVLVDGEKISPKCGKSCHLNLHGYTERNQFSDPTSSSAAVGIMIGVGSFSPYLLPYEESQTFISRDAGVSWYRIFDSPYLWAFLDSGSLIVAVESMTPTNVIQYSVDEGRTWKEFVFSDEEEVVVDLNTRPSGIGHEILLLTSDDDNSPTSSVYIDFDPLYRRVCGFDFEDFDSGEGDFVKWVPTDLEGKQMCLLGRVSSYYRKNPEKKCKIGSSLSIKEELISRCQCTRMDFECDYNFRRMKEGTCVLVHGLQPPNTESEQCAVDDAVQWKESTGYKRTPMTFCEGGLPLDSGKTHACPGKEKEYEKLHPKPGNWSIIFSVSISVILAVIFGYIFYRYSQQYLKGAIRLGVDSEGESPINSSISFTKGIFASIPIFFYALYQSIRSIFYRPASLAPDNENAAFLENYEIDDEGDDNI